MITEENTNAPEGIQHAGQGDHSHIKGWGIDADPVNDPTYPMKKRTNEEQLGYSWKRPDLQPENMEVLHSNERPDVTAVFGTAPAPSGISGILRRYAFTYSESDYRHWIYLLLADRIGVYEGVVHDLKRGHIPNLLIERGIVAEWKYNRKQLVKKTVVNTLITTAAIALIVAKNREKDYHKKGFFKKLFRS